MAKLDILEFPDPRLRRRAEPVDRVDDDLRALIDDMFETMYAAPGVGLAATQVNDTRRLMVIDVSENKDEPLVFINPEILEQEGKQKSEEGCLSVPGIFADVPRAERVRVKALDRDGNPFEMEADDLMAVCIQHEIDHLNGRLFVDYLSPLKRQRVKKILARKRRSDDGHAAPAKRAI